MASEHVHRWAFRPSFDASPEMYCVVPGCTATEPVEHDPANPRFRPDTLVLHDNRVDKLEQQLAEARAIIEVVADWNIALHDTVGHARTWLEKYPKEGEK